MQMIWHYLKRMLNIMRRQLAGFLPFRPYHTAQFIQTNDSIMNLSEKMPFSVGTTRNETGILTAVVKSLQTNGTSFWKGFHASGLIAGR